MPDFFFFVSFPVVLSCLQHIFLLDGFQCKTDHIHSIFTHRVHERVWLPMVGVA
jgi:hypothetical protein